jgi:hypothetical protein
LATPALIWQDTINGLRALWEMNGGVFTDRYVNLPTVTPAIWRIVANADFNGDATDDLVWQNLASGSRAIWLMNGTSWAGDYVVLPSVTTDWEIVAAADFSADGRADLVWQNLTTGYRAIWYMNGPTWTGNYVTLPIVPAPWSIVGTGRFNSDAHPDLIWENRSSGQRAIWYMNGGTWTGIHATLPSVPTGWSIAGAADFNADNNTDLIWENLTTGQRAIWYMSGGTWTGTYSNLPVVPGHWQIAGAFSGVSNICSLIECSNQVMVKSATSCALRASGALWCWGENSGHFGNGDEEESAAPMRAGGGMLFKSVDLAASGSDGNHACGVARSGRAYCWGSNFYGQLGDASNTESLSPTPVHGNWEFVVVETGDTHSCGIITSGVTLCWGRNQRGQLGIGSLVDRDTPAAIAFNGRMVQLTSGDNFTCGIDSQGVAFCWGQGDRGQLGTGTLVGADSPTAVDTNLRFFHISAFDSDVCALDLTGAAHCWGGLPSPPPPLGGPSGTSARPAASSFASSSPVAVATALRFSRISASVTRTSVPSRRSVPPTAGGRMEMDSSGSAV